MTFLDALRSDRLKSLSHIINSSCLLLWRSFNKHHLNVFVGRVCTSFCLWTGVIFIQVWWSINHSDLRSSVNNTLSCSWVHQDTQLINDLFTRRTSSRRSLPGWAGLKKKNFSCYYLLIVIWFISMHTANI